MRVVGQPHSRSVLRTSSSKIQLLIVYVADAKPLGHVVSAKVRNRRKVEWEHPFHPEPARPTTLGPWSPRFAINISLRISTASILGRNRQPLLEGLGRPPRLGRRAGVPLGEVSNENQQTALLPRPGSWEPQAQPQSERARVLLKQEGGKGKGCLASFPSNCMGLCMAPTGSRRPRSAKATEHALFSERGWYRLVLDPASFLYFHRWVENARQRYRLGLRRLCCLPAAPA